MRKYLLVIVGILVVSITLIGCGARNKDDSKKIEEQQEKYYEDLGENMTEEDNDTEGIESSKLISEDDDKVIIEQPKEGSQVMSGEKLIIKGKTLVSQFHIEIEDGHNILAEKTVEVNIKDGQLTDFEVTLDLDKHTSPAGMIIINPQGTDTEPIYHPIKFE